MCDSVNSYFSSVCTSFGRLGSSREHVTDSSQPYVHPSRVSCRVIKRYLCRIQSASTCRFANVDDRKCGSTIQNDNWCRYVKTRLDTRRGCDRGAVFAYHNRVVGPLSDGGSTLGGLGRRPGRWRPLRGERCWRWSKKWRRLVRGKRPARGRRLVRDRRLVRGIRTVRGRRLVRGRRTVRGRRPERGRRPGRGILTGRRLRWSKNRIWKTHEYNNIMSSWTTTRDHRRDV